MVRVPKRVSQTVGGSVRLWGPPLGVAAQALRDVYRGLGSSCHEHREVESYFFELFTYAVELVPSIDMAGIAIVDNRDTASAVAGTAPAVDVIDEVAYRICSGLSLYAAYQRKIVTADYSAAGAGTGEGPCVRCLHPWFDEEGQRQ